MAVKIGINGLGRIGKLVFRLAATSSDIELVHLNDPMSTDLLAHLLQYDTVHGKFSGDIVTDGDRLLVDGRPVSVTHAREPATIPWENTGAGIVVDASGKFTTAPQLQGHLRGAVRKVILSCPPGDDSIHRTVVMGVNHHLLSASDSIISNASCTTNCVAPMLKVLQDAFGVRKAFMNTVHPYTNNQAILDGPHPDFRRARAAGSNLIPTTSSAIRSIALVMPEFASRFDGFATRVPVPDGSFVELTALLDRQVNPQMIRDAFLLASNHSLRGYLEYCTVPVVSSDIIGNPGSVVFDSLCVKVLDGDFVQLVGWYDNEFGYSNRIMDLIRYISKL